MSKITSKSSLNSLGMLSFLLLCSLFASQSTFSRNHWRADFFNPRYHTPSNAFIMRFEVMDYQFGPGNENGYLLVGDFEYSADGVNFTHLFRCDVRDQNMRNSTKMIMRFKKFGENLQFLDCFQPGHGYYWADDDTAPTVVVPTQPYDLSYVRSRKAYMTMKWTPGPENKDVNYIRIKGFWKVNGAYDGDWFDQVYKVTKYRMEPDPDEL